VLANSSFAPASDPFAGTVVSTGPSPYINEHIAPQANMLQQSLLPSPEELAYKSGDLHPMTMAFPQEVTNQQASNLTPYALTSDMNPLPLDAFDLPQDITKLMEPDYASDQPVFTPIPADLLPPVEIPSSPAPLPQNTPMSAATERPSAQIPDIAGDSILESVMEQAQVGLFIIPAKL
jgi:hypothetical protein